MSITTLNPLMLKLITILVLLVALLAVLRFYFGKKFYFSWAGKLIGFVLGFIIAKSVGALIGLAFGHIFDMLITPKRKSTASAQKTSSTAAASPASYSIYFDTLFSVLGHFDRAAGEVSTADLNHLHALMRRMNLSEQAQRNAWEWYKYGQNPRFNISQALFSFSRHCKTEPMFEENLWHILLGEANAQAPLTTGQYAILSEVGHVLGISLDEIRHLAPKNEKSRKKQGEKVEEVTTSEPSEYQILGLKPGAAPSEIKLAYRKLMGRYHPDRLMSKDLPEEFLELATRRTQEIKAAYEKICKERGI